MKVSVSKNPLSEIHTAHKLPASAEASSHESAHVCAQAVLTVADTCVISEMRTVAEAIRSLLPALAALPTIAQSIHEQQATLQRICNRIYIIEPAVQQLQYDVSKGFAEVHSRLDRPHAAVNEADQLVATMQIIHTPKRSGRRSTGYNQH